MSHIINNNQTPLQTSRWKAAWKSLTSCLCAPCGKSSCKPSRVLQAQNIALLQLNEQPMVGPRSFQPLQIEVLAAAPMGEHPHQVEPQEEKQWPVLDDLIHGEHPLHPLQPISDASDDDDQSFHSAIGLPGNQVESESEEETNLPLPRKHSLSVSESRNSEVFEDANPYNPSENQIQIQEVSQITEISEVASQIIKPQTSSVEIVSNRPSLSPLSERQQVTSQIEKNFEVISEFTDPVMIERKIDPFEIIFHERNSFKKFKENLSIQKCEKLIITMKADGKKEYKFIYKNKIFVIIFDILNNSIVIKDEEIIREFLETQIASCTQRKDFSKWLTQELLPTGIISFEWAAKEEESYAFSLSYDIPQAVSFSGKIVTAIYSPTLDVTLTTDKEIKGLLSKSTCTFESGITITRKHKGPDGWAAKIISNKAISYLLPSLGSELGSVLTNWQKANLVGTLNIQMDQIGFSFDKVNPSLLTFGVGGSTQLESESAPRPLSFKWFKAEAPLKNVFTFFESLQSLRSEKEKDNDALRYRILKEFNQLPMSIISLINDYCQTSIRLNNNLLK